MLKHVDLSVSLEKEEYKQLMKEYRPEMGRLQRKAHDLGVPVILVFEGWDAAGKGTLINRLLLSLDARGFTVHTIGEPNEEQRFRPFLWRFWTRTPPKGRIAIFDRSWYWRAIQEFGGKKKSGELSGAYDEIKDFERQLTEDGALIIKFFLHISKKKQRTRFKKLEKKKSTSWRVSQDDWKNHKNYDQFTEIFEEKLYRTDTEFAPWTVVEMHDLRHATTKVFRTVMLALENRLSRPATSSTPPVVPPPAGSGLLARVDHSLSLTREQYDARLDDLQLRLRELEFECYRKRMPVVIVYEGWDAAGKGGNIRRVVEKLDPRGYDVIPIAAPNDVEKAHHYLWRFWQQLPKAGHFAIFDRSWYGRVLVERVEGFATEAEWRRAYREINEFEEDLFVYGTVVVKFWLDIHPDEQLRRFEERQESEYKRWKITDEDWRNRKRWSDYEAAVEEMILRTSTSHAPWTIVESDNKLYARIKALETIVKALEERL